MAQQDPPVSSRSFFNFNLAGKKGRITANDKRVLNSKQVDVNQIMPMKYRWAFEYYIKGCANTWMPSEIEMTADVATWSSSDLTEDERRVVEFNVGFFCTAESLVANNLMELYSHITNPELRQYMLRQGFEEGLHTHSMIHILDTMYWEADSLFNMYQEIESIHAKDALVMELTSVVLQPGFTTTTQRGIQDLLKNVLGFYLIQEGIYFYGGFATLLSFQNRNLLPGIGTNIELTLRDESIHINFGADLFLAIVNENPEVWTSEFIEELYHLIDRAVTLEAAFCEDSLRGGVFGVTTKTAIQYIRYVADRRLERIGLKAIYNVKNPYPWMSSCTDLPKEKNFFESRVTDYQTAAGLVW